MSETVFAQILDPEDGTEWFGTIKIATKSRRAHFGQFHKQTNLPRPPSKTLFNGDVINGFYRSQTPMAIFNWRTQAHGMGGVGRNYVRQIETISGTFDSMLIGDFYNVKMPIKYKSASCEYFGLQSTMLQDLISDPAEGILFEIKPWKLAKLRCSVTKTRSSSISSKSEAQHVKLTLLGDDGQGFGAAELERYQRYLLNVVSIISGIDYSASPMRLCRLEDSDSFNGPDLTVLPKRFVSKRALPFSRCRLSPKRCGEAMTQFMVGMEKLQIDVATIADNLRGDAFAEDILFWMIPILDKATKTFASDDERSFAYLEKEFFDFVEGSAPPDLLNVSKKHLDVKQRKFPSHKILVERCCDTLIEEGYKMPAGAAKAINEARNPLFHGGSPKVDLSYSAYCVQVTVLNLLFRAVGILPSEIESL